MTGLEPPNFEIPPAKDEGRSINWKAGWLVGSLAGSFTTAAAIGAGLITGVTVAAKALRWAGWL